MSQALTVYSDQQRHLIKSVLAKGCDDDEVALFIEVAKHLGLDPFKRQIYAIPRGRGEDRKVTFQTGIDGYRLLAERSGKYAGQIGPQWCGSDGVWVDVWLKKEAPAAARVGILRTDFREPVWGIARTEAYRQSNNNLWNTMADVLIAKCAEANAIRRTFPDMVSGIYTDTEMEQADAPRDYVDAEPVTPPATPAPRQQPAKRPQAQQTNVLNPSAEEVERALTATCERLQVSKSAVKVLREAHALQATVPDLLKLNDLLSKEAAIAEVRVYHWLLQHGIAPGRARAVAEHQMSVEDIANFTELLAAIEANQDDMLAAFQQAA